MDETPTHVLGEDGRKNTTKSYMWVAKGEAEGKPVVLFKYSPSRAGTVAEEIVGDFHGFLQSDGYSGYNELEKSDAITRVGCLVHLRRKFHDVVKAGSKKKKGITGSVLNLIGKVYQIEKQAKKQNFLPDEILALREEKIKPILDKIADILKKISRQCLSKISLRPSRNLRPEPMVQS